MAKTCQKCHMTLEKDIEDCMCLPEGHTCADCAYFRNCTAMGTVRVEGQKVCDWYPIRFRKDRARCFLRYLEQEQKAIEQAIKEAGDKSDKRYLANLLDGHKKRNEIILKEFAKVFGLEG